MSHRACVLDGLRLVQFGIIVLFSACISSGAPSSTSPTPSQRTLVVTADGTQLKNDVPTDDHARFDATPNRVYIALIAAFTQVGMEPTLLDPQARRVSTFDLKRTRRLGASALSLYFVCGTSMTGAKADNDRLTIRSTATATGANATGGDAGKTDVTLRISAIAQSLIGTDTAPVECGSTGRLERAIFSAVTARLAFR